MCPAGDDSQKPQSELARLRGEIEECERFVALCERIKHLEQLEERNSLAIKKQKLQAQIAESEKQIESVANELRRNELALGSTERPMGAAEQEDLKQSIRFAKTRVRTLQIFVDDGIQQIRRIDEDMQNNAKTLQDLYVQLEQEMASKGLHPNTVNARLRELLERKTLIAAVKRANATPRTAMRNDPSIANTVTHADGTPLDEEQFFHCFINDLQLVKKSIEIVSADLSPQRSGQIMPLLANLVAAGKNVTVYTRPPNDLSEAAKQQSQSIITIAHKMRVTVKQQSDIPLGAAIIDAHICWEGGINILGDNTPGKTMRRIVGGIKTRELRRFLFEQHGSQKDQPNRWLGREYRRPGGA
jgi:hypothetical protein